MRLKVTSMIDFDCLQEHRVWQEKEATKATKDAKEAKDAKEESKADKKDDSSKTADATGEAPHSNGNADGPDSNSK